ncbi:MAG TPA: hypothetical protein VFP97_04950 [Chitinophagaceae bacterium]|nr:hypothetical protein [Chitinophagaceae bacterium]
MKSIVMPVHEQLDQKTTDHPDAHREFSEVKETVAKTIPIHVGIKNQKGKKFTVQEMWNRQRQGRSASDMIRRTNLN